MTSSSCKFGKEDRRKTLPPGNGIFSAIPAIPGPDVYKKEIFTACGTQSESFRQSAPVTPFGKEKSGRNLPRRSRPNLESYNRYPGPGTYTPSVSSIGRQLDSTKHTEAAFQFTLDARKANEDFTSGALGQQQQGQVPKPRGMKEIKSRTASPRPAEVSAKRTAALLLEVDQVIDKADALLAKTAISPTRLPARLGSVKLA
ncbi:hypothetical protein CYMTET_11694 [Cymbomonas tetramitiformis]|uniref:Flagellar associated protein n=1 Tax=Cymbomonas tetramitiformis TaxID=36881 RepID=A0AAE0GM18_9CHLO|nr:hypothetical protein CYMTET_11694 [Cymbomonas tetramitiformis]